MMILYGAYGSCSLPAEVMLAMINDDNNRVVNYEDSSDLPESYYEINPLGQVPSLVVDGEVMTQSAAILTYLADTHPEINMAPSIDSPERMHYLRWMGFLNSSVHESFLHYWYSRRFVLSDDEAESVKAVSVKRLEFLFGQLENHLADKQFLTGDVMYACDLYLATLVTWHENMDEFFGGCPNVKKTFDRVMEASVVKDIFDQHDDAE